MFSQAQKELQQKGYYSISAAQLAEFLRVDTAFCLPLFSSWNDLPPDAYLLDGGRYRFRRHGSFVQRIGNRSTTSKLLTIPQRPHWQPKAYNALHGGLSRSFAPLSPLLMQSPVWKPLLVGLGELFAGVRPSAAWFIESHQFRITTDGGVGLPTPEGVHQDGVDFVAIILIDRHQVSGGETRVYSGNGAEEVHLTLREACSMLLLDDTRVLHETTAIFPLQGVEGGWRDTLVLTYRAKGFLDPDS